MLLVMAEAIPTRPRRWLSCLVALTALGACGDKDSAAGDGCAPSGTSLSISAQNLAFDKACLAAPAGQALTIDFDNKEVDVPHNVVILKGPDGAEPVFTGATFNGAKKMTYEVPALAAGPYEFQCSVHPGQMKGTFVVK